MPLTRSDLRSKNRNHYGLVLLIVLVVTVLTALTTHFAGQHFVISLSSVSASWRLLVQNEMRRAQERHRLSQAQRAQSTAPSSSGSACLEETASQVTRSQSCSSGKEPPATEPLPSAACPEGWIGFGSKCFYFSDDTRNWTSSQLFCASEGANLTHIDSQEELVRAALGVFSAGSQLGGGAAAWGEAEGHGGSDAGGLGGVDFLKRIRNGFAHWIGLSRKSSNDPWTWVDNTGHNVWGRLRTGRDEHEGLCDEHEGLCDGHGAVWWEDMGLPPRRESNTVQNQHSVEKQTAATLTSRFNVTGDEDYAYLNQVGVISGRGYVERNWICTYDHVTPLCRRSVSDSRQSVTAQTPVDNESRKGRKALYSHVARSAHPQIWPLME
ncbi:C-type lectin domain family 2 member D-related protein [Galemys pyrenaicus]|uniref:C-type lectin domain family 2 member D-related protein n=1 Tax=Galemys pyrenaicus TaxID=202257 RepID=A0A8J5ZU13_GALPY|nr:C-type lectin domain family 2 member D-related protein [Galemys pyrenaicus]